LAGRFAVDSFALTDYPPSGFKLSGSIRRLFESPNESHQLRQLGLVKFVEEQGRLLALVLKDFVLSLSVHLSPNVHAAARAGEGLILLGSSGTAQSPIVSSDVFVGLIHRAESHCLGLYQRPCITCPDSIVVGGLSPWKSFYGSVGHAAIRRNHKSRTLLQRQNAHTDFLLGEDRLDATGRRQSLRRFRCQKETR
jgi:hypothetical protein